MTGLKWFAAGLWLLSIAGFAVAFTVDPDAVNMGIGCAIPAAVVTLALVWPV